MSRTPKKPSRAPAWLTTHEGAPTTVVVTSPGRAAIYFDCGGAADGTWTDIRHEQARWESMGWSHPALSGLSRDGADWAEANPFIGVRAYAEQISRGVVKRRDGRTLGYYSPAVETDYVFAIIAADGSVLGRYFDAFEAVDDFVHGRAQDQPSAAQVEAWRLEDVGPNICRQVDYQRAYLSAMVRRVQR